MAQISVGALQVTAIRNGKVKTFANASPVPDVVQKKSHATSLPHMLRAVAIAAESVSNHSVPTHGEIF